MNNNRLTQYIATNEGLRLHPYKCTAGKLTIGYGRNLEDKGISADEAWYMLKNDIAEVSRNLCSRFSYSQIKSWSENRMIALADLMFNLGATRFGSFRKMIKAVKDQDWNKAADEMLDSRYARQLSSRASENAEMLRKG